MLERACVLERTQGKGLRLRWRTSWSWGLNGSLSHSLPSHALHGHTRPPLQDDTDLWLLKGDRVVGFTGNNVNTLVAMLAATSIGALWSGVSTDTGVHAVLERLRQIEPKVLFADNASVYNGKVHPTHSKVQEITADLASLEAVVVFEAVRGQAFDLQAIKPSNGKVLTYADFVSASKSSSLEFVYLPPDHPVYIL